jgi:hypothetical protein
MSDTNAHNKRTTGRGLRAASFLIVMAMVRMREFSFLDRPSTGWSTFTEIRTENNTTRMLIDSVVMEKQGAFNSSSATDTTFPTRSKNSKTCVTPELIGNWSHAKIRNFTHAYCCDRHKENPGDRHYCQDRNSSSDGSFFQGSHTGLAWTPGGGCEKKCRRNFRDKYVWKSPNLPPWNPTEFCQLLGPHRRIIMIGDSTMSQAAATLMNAVHGLCQTQLFFFMVDTLIKKAFGVLNRGPHWLEIVQNHSITHDGDIVVLTVGAHIVHERDLYKVSDLVLQQIVAMKAERPSVTVIYKTQQPGGCTPEIANLSLSPLQAGATFDFSRRHNFNYPHFYNYDSTVIGNLQEFGIPYLDMRMLYSRSDAHPSSKRRNLPIDCLHLCSPGPLDMFAILFLHLLKNNFAVSQCAFEY